MKKIMKSDIKNVTIAYLKDHPEHVTTCAQWSFDQWGHHTPERTLDGFIASRKEYLNKDALPMTFLALHDGKPIGMCSLTMSKNICTHLAPWLYSLYVVKEWRNKGIGRLLQQTVCDQAQRMGYQTIYLFTSDETVIPWYENHGWHKKSTEWLHNHYVTVLEKKLQ